MVIVANLKPRNMRGIKSNGMVLCASNEEHTEVEPLAPPEGAAVGERLWFGEGDGSDQGEPAKPNQVDKKKMCESAMRGVWGREGARGAAGVVSVHPPPNPA